jgi:hypothetical protein
VLWGVITHVGHYHMFSNLHSIQFSHTGTAHLLVQAAAHGAALAQHQVVEEAGEQGSMVVPTQAAALQVLLAYSLASNMCGYVRHDVPVSSTVQLLHPSHVCSFHVTCQYDLTTTSPTPTHRIFLQVPPPEHYIHLTLPPTWQYLGCQGMQYLRRGHSRRPSGRQLCATTQVCWWGQHVETLLPGISTEPGL